MAVSNKKPIKILFWSLAVSSAVLYVTELHAAEDETTLKFSTGFEYSSGSYGFSKDTDIVYIPFTFKYETFPWSFKTTLPLVQITGPGGVIAGVDGITVIDSPENTTTVKKRTTEKGLGDIILSSSYALDSLLDTSLLLDLTGKVKIATADESKGLGTGKNDYSLQLDIARKYGKTTPFSTLGYKVTGDPNGVRLNDVWYGSLGFEYKIKPSLSSGLSFDKKQAITSGSEVSKEVVAYLNWKLNPEMSLMAYGIAGFSDGSPDNGIGIQISFKK